MLLYLSVSLSRKDVGLRRFFPKDLLDSVKVRLMSFDIKIEGEFKEFNVPGSVKFTFKKRICDTKLTITAPQLPIWSCLVTKSNQTLCFCGELHSVSEVSSLPMF